MLKDIFEAQADSLYDPEVDQTIYKTTDTRKPKLTLKIINSLRKYREFKRSEMEKRSAVVSMVYAKPEEQQNNGLQ